MGKRCIAKGEVWQRAIFSENHSKREKGLKVKSDALAKLIIHERTGRLQTNNKLLSKYHSVTQSLLCVTQ